MLAKSYNKENLVRSLFATVCAMVTHSMLKEAPWRVELRFSFSKIFPLSAESLSLKNRHFWYFQAFCYQSFKNDITLSAGGYRRVREGTGGYGRVREGTGGYGKENPAVQRPRVLAAKRSITRVISKNL